MTNYKANRVIHQSTDGDLARNVVVYYTDYV
jgi:hypothetical protein